MAIFDRINIQVVRRSVFNKVLFSIFPLATYFVSIFGKKRGKKKRILSRQKASGVSRVAWAKDNSLDLTTSSQMASSR